MTEATGAFVAGSYWTPDRARDAIARMQATLASPAFTAMFDAGMDDDGGAPDAILALAPKAPQPDIPADAPLTYRRALSGDIPRMATMMAAEELPPLFIEEFLGGFVVAEAGHVVVAVGGAEMYGDTVAIRSVVVDPRLRGTGAGRGIADRLLDDACAFGAQRAYLFTQHARPFWLHLGFEDFPVYDWVEEARASWQWQFVSRHAAEMGEIYSMRKTL